MGVISFKVKGATNTSEIKSENRHSLTVNF